MPLRTLSSQTPSQLHSSCFCRLGVDSTSLPSVSLLLRYARQAFQAPEFPAASNGNVSNAVSSSKARFIYSRTLAIDRLGEIKSSGRVRLFPIRNDSDLGEDSVELRFSGGGGLYRSSRCSTAFGCALLTFLELAVEDWALFCDRPNQYGNPCLRLKPPGGSRSSSVALTVSELEDPVVYVYAVNGATRGWKMSLMKVMVGGRVG